MNAPGTGQGIHMNVFELNGFVSRALSGLKALSNANQIGHLLCKPSRRYNETNLMRSRDKHSCGGPGGITLYFNSERDISIDLTVSPTVDLLPVTIAIIPG